MRTKPVLIILGLLGTYVGPYLFVYARTATWTYPRIDERDLKAIDNVDVSVDSTVKLMKSETVVGAQQATYSVTIQVKNRKFADWIGFPIALEVVDLRFEAAGVSQGKLVLVCDHLEPALEQPPGNLPWYEYQPLVDKNNNNALETSCKGDASSIDMTSLPALITLNWSISATLIGDRNEGTRSWASALSGQAVEIQDARA